MNIDLEKYLELNWREVTCKRAVNDNNFPLGIQDFDFSVSGSTNAWIPAYSYFRVDATLEMVQADGTVREPTLADRTAFALSSPHGLYSNCYFRCGGQDVSTMTSFISQSGALRERIGKSGAWIAKVGRNVAYSDPDFTRRCHSISLDGYYNEDGLEDLTVPNFLNVDQNQSAISQVGTQQTLGNQNNLFLTLNNSNICNPIVFRSVSNEEVESKTTEVTVIVNNPTELILGDDVNANLVSPTGNILLRATFGADISLNFTGLIAGDILVTSDAAATVPTQSTFFAFNVISIISDTAAIVSPVYSGSGTDNIPAFSSTANVSCFAYRPGLQSVGLQKKVLPNRRCGKNTIYMNFQPSLGIFDLHQGMGSGDFKFQLNPNVNYQTSCVETVGRCVPVQFNSENKVSYRGQYNVVPWGPVAPGTVTPGVLGTVGYNLKINNVLLYIATIKQPMPMSGILPLSLMETQIMQKNMSSTSAGSSNQLDFTVPPSTLAITVWVQAGNVGNTSAIPPSKFKVAQGNNTPDENLQYIQVTYGSSTKPSTLYTSDYNKANGTQYDLYYNGNTALAAAGNIAEVFYNSSVSSRMQQRWIQSQQNAGKLGNDGGTESYLDYLDMGPYYHFDFSRDKADSSSYVNVQIQYNSNLPAGTNLYICAWYSRQVEIAFESGVVTSVVSVNR